MAADPQKSIYRGAAVCGLLIAAALIVPRFVPPDEGFVAGATAVLVFAGLLIVAAVAALYLLVKTLHMLPRLSTAARICGIAPAVTIVIGCLSLWTFLAY